MTIEERLDHIDSIVTRLLPIIPAMSSLVTIQSSIDEINTNIKAERLESDKQIGQLKRDMTTLQTQNNKLAANNESLRDKFNRLEAYSRRNNLIIYNVPEDDKTPLEKIQKTLREDL